QDLKYEMRYDMQDFKCEMQSEMQDFKNEMRGEMQDFKCEVQGFKGEMWNEIHQIKLFQENILVPRLDTIESCYLDTYRRYRDNVDRMEAVFEDVDLMKKVLVEHSKQLQKLA
ncbi:MAG: hypothetical protein K2H40_14675, partial [Lachnospiraceae bacterium]|nr:hypothetical protein [Lachnospiraceae bacterium]